MSVPYFGDFAEDATVYIPFNTFTSDDPSASCTITNLINTDIHIHKDDGTTQRNNAAGITVSVDFDSITGNHLVSIDTSDDTVAGFWVTGHDYFVRMEGTTVDGATINAWIGSFSIENRFMRGTDSAALASVCTEARLSELDAGTAGKAANQIDEIRTDTTDLIIHETTIASVTDDKTFTLTDSGLDGDTSADDDAWNNASVVIEDVTGSAKELRKVSDYGGVAKQIILDRVCKFNLAAGDKVRFHPAYVLTGEASIAEADKNEIADKVWDELQNDHKTVGSTGHRLFIAPGGRHG